MKSSFWLPFLIIIGIGGLYFSLIKTSRQIASSQIQNELQVAIQERNELETEKDVYKRAYICCVIRGKFPSNPTKEGFDPYLNLVSPVEWEHFLKTAKDEDVWKWIKSGDRKVIY